MIAIFRCAVGVLLFLAVAEFAFIICGFVFEAIRDEMKARRKGGDNA